jgi:hypothetical protein
MTIAEPAERCICEAMPLWLCLDELKPLADPLANTDEGISA